MKKPNIRAYLCACKDGYGVVVYLGDPDGCAASEVPEAEFLMGFESLLDAWVFVVTTLMIDPLERICPHEWTYQHPEVKKPQQMRFL